MRSKLALLAAVMAVGSLFTASAAQAKTVKLYVYPRFAVVDECRVNPGTYKFAIQFGAKFKRKNSPYPKSVVFKYSVADSSNGTAVASGTATLTKRNKWKSITDLIPLTTGGSYTLTINGSFKSPTSHHTYKNSDTEPILVPTDAQLDQLNPPLPACV